MIKANDLRIGNKIRMAGSTYMVNTVFDISDNTRRNQIEFKSEEHKRMYSHLITVEENGNQYKPFEIEGIPLTEKILKNASFSGLNFWHKKGFFWRINIRGPKFYMVMDEDDIANWIELQYVHPASKSLLRINKRRISNQFIVSKH
jgi:hypothetical protein